jgi:HAD superfamily hydrolase (TIGR01509 family)
VRAVFADCTGKRTRDLVDAFRVAAQVPHALDHLLEVRHVAFREAFAKDPPGFLPGAEDVLRDAAALGPVCLVTSGYREDALATLDALGVRGLFKDFVTGEDVEMPKPHPEPYRTAAVRLGVAPEEVLVFEDSGRGVAAAKAAGCRVAAVPNPRNTPREAVAAADVILGSMEEALPLHELMASF